MSLSIFALILSEFHYLCFHYWYKSEWYIFVLYYTLWEWLCLGWLCFLCVRGQTGQRGQMSGLEALTYQRNLFLAVLGMCVLSRVWLFASLWTTAHHPPLSVGFPTRILEWVAISFSRGSSWPWDRTELQVDSLPLSHQEGHCMYEFVWVWELTVCF